jgi:hypothetical protein
VDHKRDGGVAAKPVRGDFTGKALRVAHMFSYLLAYHSILYLRNGVCEGADNLLTRKLVCLPSSAALGGPPRKPLFEKQGVF